MMPSSNFKLFDENKQNMLSDQEYNISNQRLNGVQAGIASSQLQNKSMHQSSLIAYALAQIMNQNGFDANDTDAVVTFISNLRSSIAKTALDECYAKQQDFSDATKQNYGLAQTAVPSDAFNLILNALSNIQNNANGRAKYEIGSYVGQSNVSSGTVEKIIYFNEIVPDLVIISDGGSSVILIKGKSRYAVIAATDHPGYGTVEHGSNYIKLTATSDGYFYSPSTAAMNSLNFQYVYFAIGSHVDTAANYPMVLTPVVGKGINLLDNSYFIGGGHAGYENLFPINQRGFADYTNYTGTAIDRWALAGGTLNLATGYATLKATNSGPAMFQRLEGHRLVNGVTYTLSILTTDDLYSAQFVADNSGAYFVGIGIGDYFYATGTYISQFDLWDIIIARQWDGTGERSVSIKAMKLELGGNQSLARQVNGAWVLNDPPPNYQQELAKCQRYLCRFGQNDRFQPIAGTTDALVTTPVPLRAGVVTIINPQNIGGNTWSGSGAGIAVHNAFTNQLRIRGTNTVGTDVELSGDVYFSVEP